jgi:hypothetical protein
MVLVMVRAMRPHRRMEMDMVSLLRSSSYLCLRSKAVLAALLFLIICWVVPLLFVQQAHAEEKEGVLPESGIRYPGGFDPNTVGSVEGTVHGYFQPKSGPVGLQVVSERETYTVLVSPAWYWKDLGAKVSDGTQVRVRGSKSLGRDGKLYIIAQEIQILPSGQSLVFRSEDGFPLWKGSRRKTMGRHRGFGSSQPGMGGTRGGSGGMGRGRH